MSCIRRHYANYLNILQVNWSTWHWRIQTRSGCQICSSPTSVKAIFITLSCPTSTSAYSQMEMSSTASGNENMNKPDRSFNNISSHSGFHWLFHARWTSSCTHSIVKCARCSWSLVSVSVISIGAPFYYLLHFRRLDHRRFGFSMEERRPSTSGKEHASA